MFQSCAEARWNAQYSSASWVAASRRGRGQPLERHVALSTLRRMPLHLPVEDPCPFCADLAGDRPYTILERTTLTALLVTFEQRGVGHVLAVPIAHRVTLMDLSTAVAHVD